MQIATVKLQEGEASFTSLNQMREEHIQLLEHQGEDSQGLPEKTRTLSPQINAFLRRGIGLGRSLDSPALRAEAQGMLDYWVSTLSIQQRGMEEGKTRSFETAILESFDASVLKSAISGAIGLLKRFSDEEEQQARRMLMRLAPMASRGDHFELVTLQTDELTGGEAAQLRMLEEFEKTGVVTRIDSADDREDGWRLAHQSVISRWLEFAEWTAARRRFRQGAKLWDESGRAKQRLPQSEESVAEPMGYRDLNALESDYLEATSAELRINAKRKRRFLAGALTVLLTGLALIGLLGWSLDRAKGETESAKDEAKTAKGDLEESEKDRIKTEIEAFKTSTNSTEVLKLRDENAKLREELSVIRKQLRGIQNTAQSSEAEEKIKELSERLSHNFREQQQERAKAGSAPFAQVVAPYPNIKSGKLEPLLPGIPVSTDDPNTKSFGSAGIFLTDGQGGTYLAAPTYVIGSKVGQIVTMQNREIGVIKQIYGEPPGAPTNIAIARLKRGLKARNLLPSVGSITGWVKSPEKGQEVILIGQGSGIRSGRILRVEKNGRIITNRISKPGDGGAPVVTKDGKLVGLLLLGRDDESVIAPSSDLLRETGLKLLKTNRDRNAFNGALAEIIVPDSDEKYANFGTKLIKRLRKDDIFILDGEPLQRPNSPQKTDIRFYYPEDEALAKKIQETLRKAGFKEFNVYNNAAYTTVDGGALPPRKFIQISFNKEELDRVISRNP